MSLIHEALEKLDQEGTGSKQPLSSGKAPVGAEKGNYRSRFVFIFLSALVSVGLFYLFLVSPHRIEKSKNPSLRSSPVVSPASLGRKSFLLSKIEEKNKPWKKPKAFALTGILLSREERTAIVNNQLVRVGDWVSGAKLVRIEQGEVTLDDDGQTVSLRM